MRRWCSSGEAAVAVWIQAFSTPRLRKLVAIRVTASATASRARASRSCDSRPGGSCSPMPPTGKRFAEIGRSRSFAADSSRAETSQRISAT
ncbi:MAG: hypothetical protein NT031_07490 [Planctomycetota bacterium]|nr:hypothetical protein [Planctomycetota bacterium]